MLLQGNVFLSILYLLVAVNYIILFYLPEKKLKTSSRILVIMSIILHFSFLAFIASTKERLALATLFEILSLLALFLTIMLFLIEVKTREKSIGAFISPFIFCLQLLSSMGDRIPILDKSIIQMPLLGFHTLTTVIGYTCFIYSFILTIMYFFLIKRLKGKKYDSLFFGLPPLELLEKLNIIVQFTGLILLSLGLISGISLSILIWKEIPIFDPKILLTMALWLIYLASLLAGSLFKRPSQTMNFASIAGFCVIIIIIFLESLTQATIHRF
ncbi:MAG: cytochrome c biogenesis protein CcsA [Spirochaetales bacterium]|nr:cytochrome c biogenesis protein CcsA [Spirochaetales bacterium]